MREGDRLLQVITVKGRPLALARAAALASTGSPIRPSRRGHLDHRGYWQAAWLDLSGDAYYLPHDPPKPGESVVLQPYLLSAQCQHERLAVPFRWLREQVEVGVPACYYAGRADRDGPSSADRNSRRYAIRFALGVRRPVRLVNLGTGHHLRWGSRGQIFAASDFGQFPMVQRGPDRARHPHARRPGGEVPPRGRPRQCYPKPNGNAAPNAPAVPITSA